MPEVVVAADPATAARGGLVGALLRLGVPVAVARLGIMGMSIADTVVVGRYAPGELAHQALGWAPTGVLLVAAIGLLTGVQVLAARVIGEGRPSAAWSVWRRGVSIAVVAGGVGAVAIASGAAWLLGAVGIEAELAERSGRVARVLAISIPFHLVYVASAFFLEAIRKPLASTVVIWVANLMNLALNLAWVPAHGAVGSAWATVVARGFMALAVVGWVLFSRDAVAFGVRERVLAAPGARALLRIGAAAAASHAIEMAAFAAMTVIAGRLGSASVAAYQIVLNVLALVFMVALGLGTATSVLVSEAIGRGDLPAARRAGWAGLGLNTGFMALAGAVLLLLAGPIAHAYTTDSAIAAVVVASAAIAAIVLAPDGGQVVMAQALRARGDNWFPTGSHVLAYALVMPALGWWLAEARGGGVPGLLQAILLASLLSCAVLAARFGALARADR
ncbi:MAG: MATE family efflux transporter [Polyangiaceae bacterium]|nr:MATE family efflux transporter [Polyangiaceae bacterium]